MTARTAFTLDTGGLTRSLSARAPGRRCKQSEIDMERRHYASINTRCPTQPAHSNG